MICKVIEAIEKHNMLCDTDSLCVGVSGGADSICLLHILSSLKDKYGITLKAVHLNHAIRGAEADADEAFVIDYCRKIGVECLSFKRDIPSLAKEQGLGVEQCARQIRYQCFEKAGCDKIATAHTLSDSIETMVFNLCRGTGSRGLCGIPAVRQNIIRPLIYCKRSEIEKYCEKNGLDFVTDSTNLSDDYKRNFIRHRLVPLLGEINEGFEENLLRLSDTLRAENDYLDTVASELLISAKAPEGYKASAFLLSHEAVRRRAISHLLNENMSKEAEKKHIMLFEGLIRGEESKIEISKDLYICRKGDIISIQGKTLPADKWECAIDDEGVFETPHGTYRLLLAADCERYSPDAIDGDKLTEKLILSSRRQGDSFYFKKRRLRKSLKKLFIEDKIPEEKRGEYAVLRSGDSLVWLESYGTDGDFLPDGESKNILIIKKDG